MKTSVKKLLGIVLTVSVIASLLSVAASATVVRSSNYLDAYACSANAKNNGKISVCVEVDAIVNATEIGATEIYIYESSNGEDFTCVEEYFAEDYPEMLDSGWAYYDSPIVHQGTVGKYYYAVVYVYAGNSTGGDTRRVETTTVRAIR